jgi:hypothetical protein
VTGGKSPPLDRDFDFQAELKNAALTPVAAVGAKRPGD